MTRWFCDSCGVEMATLSSVSRCYGFANYKSFCGACAHIADTAALAAIAESQRLNNRPARGFLASLRRLVSFG